MGPIEHYEKLIEGKIKLLHRGKKRAEQNIEGKQIIEIERHKRSKRERATMRKMG